MRLTCILFRKNLLPNGHLFKGKDRLVRKVLPVDLRRLQDRFEIEEKNMFYLRHPYLTEVSIFVFIINMYRNIFHRVRIL